MIFFCILIIKYSGYTKGERMNNKNQNLSDKLFNCTIELCNSLKIQALQEEIYFIPVGILLIKWINDSKERFNWDISDELSNLLADDEYYIKQISSGYHLDCYLISAGYHRQLFHTR